MLNYVLLKMAIMDFQTTPKQTNKKKKKKKPTYFVHYRKPIFIFDGLK